MELTETSISSPNLHETEEGIEVKLFLQTLKRIYHVNESVGTYVCSKMKNFMNNYRHKTRRLIYEGLRANKIISSKVNDIIDTSLKESNFEKVFESLADLYYSSEFNRTVGNPAVCKVQPQPLSSPTCSEETTSMPENPTDDMETSLCTPKHISESQMASKKTNDDQETKRIHVEIGDEKHIIHLKTFNTITSLKLLLEEELALQKDGLKSMDIKYFSKGLKKWALLRSWKVLKTDETIQIHTRTVESKSKALLPIENEDVLRVDSKDPPPLLCKNNQNELQQPVSLEEQIQQVITEYKSAGGQNEWVINFKLPSFEDKMIHQIETCAITSKERIGICHTIQQHVAQYNKNPTSAEIAIIMKILFLTYPKLTEMDKDYWVTWNIWKVSLSDAFTKGRKVDEVASSCHSSRPSPKAKSSTKRKSRASTCSPGCSKKSAPSPLSSSSPLTSKDEPSLSLEPASSPQQSGDSVMEVVSTKENSRAMVPQDRLSPAMKVTFEERRCQVVKEGWSIQDVLITYPWLHNENEIFAEFSRIVELDNPVDKEIDAGFHKIVYAVLHSLKSHVKYRTILEKEKELRKDAEKKGGLRDFEYKMALFALPFSFGEDIEDIFKQEGSIYEEPIQIEFSGGSRYEDAKTFSVIIEDAKVVCSSLKKAVAVFVASFFIFNLTYPSDIKKFLYFIERNLLGIPGKAQAPSQVVKMVKKIDEYFDGLTDDC